VDGFKEKRGYSHLKEEALDPTMWRAGFGRGFGAVVRQTDKWMKERQKTTLDSDVSKLDVEPISAEMCHRGLQ
jgi:hypothetical protein